MERCFPLGFSDSGWVDQSFYDVLEVSQTASAEDIKRAWRAKVLANHPDRGGDRTTFDRIQEAYETLKDPASKAAYDASRTVSKSPPQSPRYQQTATSRTYQPPPKAGPLFSAAPSTAQQVGMLFRFTNGEAVLVSDKNQKGAWVPSPFQRRRYRMGPAWVYRVMRPRDRVFKVAPPLTPVENLSQSSLHAFFSLLASTIFLGPRWFKPRLTWLAWLLATVVLGVTALAYTASSPQTSSMWLVVWLLALVWWPLRRGVAALWAWTPGFVAGPLTAALLAALAVAPMGVGAFLWALPLCAAIGYVTSVVLRQLRKAAPVFVTTRIT